MVSSIARAIVSAEPDGGPPAAAGGADEARRGDPSGRLRALHLGVRERHLEARTAYVAAQIRAAARHPRAG